MEASVEKIERSGRSTQGAKTVSETARELRDDYRKTGYYSAQKMQLVFGDPRHGVVGRASQERCAAGIRGK